MQAAVVLRTKTVTSPNSSQRQAFVEKKRKRGNTKRESTGRLGPQSGKQPIVLNSWRTSVQGVNIRGHGGNTSPEGGKKVKVEEETRRKQIEALVAVGG